MAPEVVPSADDDSPEESTEPITETTTFKPTLTRESDIYAFAMVVIEVILFILEMLAKRFVFGVVLAEILVSEKHCSAIACPRHLQNFTLCHFRGTYVRLPLYRLRLVKLHSTICISGQSPGQLKKEAGPEGQGIRLLGSLMICGSS